MTFPYYVEENIIELSQQETNMILDLNFFVPIEMFVNDIANTDKCHQKRNKNNQREAGEEVLHILQ